MSDFKVSILNGNINILCEDEVPETDVIRLLEFDETQIEDLYLDHAAIQARWEQIAINMKNKYDNFVETFEKKWWAHNKRFARFIVQGYGDKKPTMDSIKDTVILVYSETTSDFERNKYGEVAYKAAVDLNPYYKEAKDDFMEEMFRYLNEVPAWPYEALIRTSQALEKNMLTVQNIAKRLDSRSYHMKELTHLIAAKRFNMGPVSQKEINTENELIRKISGHYPQGEK